MLRETQKPEQPKSECRAGATRGRCRKADRPSPGKEPSASSSAHYARHAKCRIAAIQARLHRAILLAARKPDEAQGLEPSAGTAGQARTRAVDSENMQPTGRGAATHEPVPIEVLPRSRFRALRLRAQRAAGSATLCLTTDNRPELSPGQVAIEAHFERLHAKFPTARYS